MFGQLASSHTVTRRFSRSLALSFWTALPDGIRTRIHDGLRSTGALANCTGERAILSPAACFAPASSADAGLATNCTGIERDGESGMADGSGGLGGRRGEGDGQRLREVGRRVRLQRTAQLWPPGAENPRLHGASSRSAAQSPQLCSPHPTLADAYECN